MVDIPSSAPTDLTSQSSQARGSEPSRSTTSTASIASADDDSVSVSGQDASSEPEASEPSTPLRHLHGHLCVVPLCGHHCWIANVEESQETNLTVAL